MKLYWSDYKEIKAILIALKIIALNIFIGFIFNNFEVKIISLK